MKELALLIEILLAIDRDNATLLENLGMVNSDAGFLQGAIKLLTADVEHSPEYAVGIVAMGVAYTRSDNLDLAAKHL